MRLFVFTILMILSFNLQFAQTSEIRVLLKSGVTVIGELQEFSVSDHVTLTVAGKSLVIPMSEIETIQNENVSEVKPQVTQVAITDFRRKKLISGKYEVTDFNAYPDSIVIKIGEQELAMLLVRGGWFNMGFDDKHSFAMASEPIHKVTLSSFYISKDVIDDHEGHRLMGKNKGSHTRPFKTENWSLANDIISAAKEETNVSLRLPTEAEWEYTAIMPFAKKIFGNNNYLEWCFDFFDAWYPEESQVNPTGPKEGKTHVRRSYSLGYNIWHRFRNNDYRFHGGIHNSSMKKVHATPCIRVVISANELF